MRYLLLALFASVAAASVGCGGDGGSMPATSPDAAVLQVAQAIDGSSGLYAEGSRSYVAVETSEGEQLLESELRPTARGAEATLRLDPGDYRLVSWQRPCDGSCDSLDSPTDRCTQPFSVEANTPVVAQIRVRPGIGCTIAVA